MICGVYTRDPPWHYPSVDTLGSPSNSLMKRGGHPLADFVGRDIFFVSGHRPLVPKRVAIMPARSPLIGV